MICIACPAKLETGGPELLHQLGYKLNLLGFDARMYYYSKEVFEDPVADAYKKYQVPRVSELKDYEGNIIILSEMVISVLERIQYAEKVLWWLSVDNAEVGELEEKILKTDKRTKHFVQSAYAYSYVTNELGIEENRVRYLSDYLNSEFLVPREPQVRDDVVLFNPAKGIDVTIPLIQASDARIKWRALKGLTPAQMRQAMEEAKVYIDFGYHPGKDRIPREAAISGCCVITNKRGAAAFPQDVAIAEDKYKFGEERSKAEVLMCIYDLLQNYEERIADYEVYRERIRNEFRVFEQEVLCCFSELEGRGVPQYANETEAIDAMIMAIESGDFVTAFIGLVSYRLFGFPESVTLDVVESTIRMNIGEYKESLFCALRGLQKESDNYELCLLVAQNAFAIGRDEMVDKYCEQAVKFSVGTEDEDTIRELCQSLLNEM